MAIKVDWKTILTVAVILFIAAGIYFAEWIADKYQEYRSGLEAQEQLIEAYRVRDAYRDSMYVHQRAEDSLTFVVQGLLIEIDDLSGQKYSRITNIKDFQYYESIDSHSKLDSLSKYLRNLSAEQRRFLEILDQRRNARQPQPGY